MRKYNKAFWKEYTKKRREKDLKLGVCVQCHKYPKYEKSKSRCEYCLKKMRELMRKRHDRLPRYSDGKGRLERT